MTTVTLTTAYDLYKKYADYYAQIDSLDKEKETLQGQINTKEREVKQHKSQIISNSCCPFFDGLRSMFSEDNSYSTGREILSNLEVRKTDVINKIRDVNLKLTNLTEAVKNPQNAFTLMVEILSLDRWKELKVLNLGNRVGLHSCIDFIKPEEMIDSIMLLSEKMQRQGLAICALHTETGRICVQTFYQLEVGSSEWTSSGDNIIFVSGYLISNGLVNISAINDLKKLVNNELPGWVLYSFKS